MADLQHVDLVHDAFIRHALQSERVSAWIRIAHNRQEPPNALDAVISHEQVRFM